MKKSELKTGDIVQDSDGKRYLVLKDCRTRNFGDQEIVFVSPDGGFLVGEYYEDLNFPFNLTVVSLTNVSRNFFSDLKNNIQSNQERNFRLQNDEFDLCIDVERFGKDQVKIVISSISTRKVFYRGVKEWTSRKEIENYFFEVWLCEAERIKKKRFVSAQKVLNELVKSSKGNSLIKVCLLTQKLKKIYLLTDEEHEKVLNEIESEQLINVFQEYFSKAPFHLD